MELIAVVLMIAAGVGLAAWCTGAIARADRRRLSIDAAPSTREEIAASVLHHVLVAGGVADSEAVRRLRQAGFGGRIIPAIDLASWGEVYARNATRRECEWLLERAVQFAVGPAPLPLRQYVAVLDLVFALGFHMDVLARLRERYGFDYVDHAKDARPREADRAGAVSFYIRSDSERLECLRVLKVDGTPTRRSIIAAYRRLAPLHHPDRFHGEPEETLERETRQFIAITRAYEKLLSFYGD